MNSLQTTIHSLSQKFADGLLEAIRGVPLEELMAETGAPRAVRKAVAADDGGWKTLGSTAKPGRAKKTDGRKNRRSPDDINDTADKIVALLQANPDGLSAEKIKDGLKIERKFLPKPILLLLSTKRIKKQGEKRATVYFAKAAA